MTFKRGAAALLGLSLIFVSSASFAGSLQCGPKDKMQSEIDKLYDMFDPSVSASGDSGFSMKVLNNKEAGSKYPMAVISEFADGTVCLTPAPQYMEP